MSRTYFRYGKYGMRCADYQRMLSDQDGKCSICGRAILKGERLCIDHDHESGDVRGLLCSPCNLMLGHAADRPDILRKAAEYLESGGDPSRFNLEGGRLIVLGDLDNRTP